MPVTCEFNQGSKMNPNTGSVEHNILCGKPAANYKCQGELTSLVMPLCEFHANHCIIRYKWKLTVVNNSELKLTK
jgi:hypothetical protein